MAKESMPWHHRYIGNPILSFLVKKFFSININDIHCGERAVSRQALEQITLYTGGMEFASEMIIKAAKANLKIAELGVSYAERIGESKLRSFRDGWRHLRFILLYSPLYLFIVPGVALFILGTILLITEPTFLSSLMIVLGYQLIFFGGFAKIYALTHLGDQDHSFEQLFQYITIERAGLIGLLIISIGCFGHSIMALTLITLGIQTFFSAFMLSILGIKEK